MLDNVQDFNFRLGIKTNLQLWPVGKIWEPLWIANFWFLRSAVKPLKHILLIYFIIIFERPCTEVLKLCGNWFIFYLFDCLKGKMISMFQLNIPIGPITYIKHNEVKCRCNESEKVHLFHDGFIISNLCPEFFQGENNSIL